MTNYSPRVLAKHTVVSFQRNLHSHAQQLHTTADEKDFIKYSKLLFCSEMSENVGTSKLQKIIIYYFFGRKNQKTKNVALIIFFRDTAKKFEKKNIIEMWFILLGVST